MPERATLDGPARRPPLPRKGVRWRPNVVDYRDGAGIRRWVTCDTRRQAQDVLSEKLRESRQASRPAVDPDITVAANLARWETLIMSGVKSRTLADYRDTFRLHHHPDPVVPIYWLTDEITPSVEQAISTHQARH